MRLELPYPPSANVYWRSYRGRMVKSAAARTYQTEAGWLAKAAGLELLAGPVAVTLRVYRPRRRGDLDNRLKIVLDALEGVCYENDKQVVELHAWLDDDRENPRVEVEITPAVEGAVVK